MAELTKEYFDKKLSEQTEELIGYTEARFDKLGEMVAKGFEDVINRLDVRDEVASLKKRIEKLEHLFDVPKQH